MSSNSTKQAIILLFLAVASLAVYSNSLNNEFVWDDQFIIVTNDSNADFSNNVSRLFLQTDVNLQDEANPYYRPLNRLTYMIDRQLFGLNTFAHHAVNILLHLANVLLVFFLGKNILTHRFPAFIAALFFALHPINAEAVNFVSARNNLLATLFILLSFLIYLKGKTQYKDYYYHAAGLLFFLALLCKEIALMLLPFMIFYDFTSFRGFKENFRERIRSLGSFFIFLAVYMALRTNALLLADMQPMHMEGVGARILQHFYIIPKYLSVILFPVNLNFLYRVPDYYFSHLTTLIVAWIAIAIGLLFLLKKKDLVVQFGLLWTVLNFFPVSNIVPVPSAPMAERYMYLPAIGLWLLAAHLVCQAYSQVRHKMIVCASVTVVVFFLGFLTYRRNFDWHDNFALAVSLTKADQDSPAAHFFLANAFHEKGDIPSAETGWKKTACMNNAGIFGNFSPFYNLGGINLQRNDLSRARNYYSLAIKSNPDSEIVHYMMALTLERLGRTADASREYQWFLNSVSPEYTHLLPEACAIICITAAETRSAPDEDDSPGDSWRSYYRFNTGSKLYYDSRNIVYNASLARVEVRYDVSKADKRSLLLNMLGIKDIYKISDIKYTFELDYANETYKVISYSIRDSDGNVLDSGEPYRKKIIETCFVIPGTPMAHLYDILKVDKAHHGIRTGSDARYGRS